MGVLTIIRPLDAVLAGTVPGVARLATYDPREASDPAPSPAARTIDLDFGSARSFGALFAGYVVGDDAPVPWAWSYGLGGPAETAGPTALVAGDAAGRPWRHWSTVLSAPITARYIRINAQVATGATIGVVDVGPTVFSLLGHEWGAGRFVVDTGNASRLKGGGFGIDEAVRVSGYQWTFGDLTPAEADALQLLKLDVGSTRPIVVFEDPDARSSLSAHYGLLTKLEPNERLNPLATRWNLRVEDWI